MKELFIEKLYECNRHVEVLKRAKNHIATLFPLDELKYRKLDDIHLSFIDQMLYRFSKLQDTMGDKIFPAVLTLLGENVKSRPFIDRLNRLEELELLEKEEWMILRKIRNDISHEYSFNLIEVVENINAIYRHLDRLLLIYDTFYHFSQDRFDFVRESPLLQHADG